MSQDLSVYDNDLTLYLFTSLTAGSSHIITATSRIETILKANKIPFKGVDTATDELARKLFGRRGGKKKLPVLVKEGYVIADLDQIEEWNEFGELKQNLSPSLSSTNTDPPCAPAAAPVPTTASTTQPTQPSSSSPPQLEPLAGGARESHRGSSVSAASADEIKEIEQASAIQEESGEEEEDEGKAGGGTVAKPQEQEAADGADAGKSVLD